ncbi:hypothetical protein B0T25DRAFT_126284 [Lasiosphaeria hispida]|uniref:DNA replication factor Cdt1 C-terminal domain-containing protein n=1 Tax=Lasiosphaeria hispida TaxID=260671 RepID=A0AAJ0HRU5_9PEZI|nr:hypothetical protein B0T25DRAFT_126284 [Lasiosphaeria hispida]
MPSAISRGSRTARGNKTAAASSKSSGSIASFTRVSKLQTIGKETIEKVAAFQTGRTSNIEIVLKSRKRGASDDFESLPSSSGGAIKKARRESEVKLQPTAVLPRKKKTVKFAEPEGVKAANTITTSFATQTLASSRKRQFQADDTETASSEAEVLLQRLHLTSSPIRKRSRTYAVQPGSENELPQELIDLLDLHMAFLKTLSMSYAHSSSNSPVDLRTIYSSVSRTWGKRQVTLDDIRVLVGVLSWVAVKTDRSSSQPSPFFISDYGRGKICIDFHPDAQSGPLREQKLNMDFEANLRTLWIGRRNENIQLFIKTLPKAAVKSCAVPLPVLAKGQRTLEELKNGVVRKQQQKEEAKVQAQAAPTLNADGTKMSLLDRVRFKELQQSQAAQGPTPAELMRRAALHRAEDIAAVIGMLCMATSSGQARISFTMVALMTKLKDSLRNPISAEDGACCVKLLATEIAPQWLRVVTIGGRENVVVQPAFRPSDVVLQERVKVLLG